MTMLSLENVGVSYAERTAVAPMCADFAAGTLVGLVGPNGAGKSSLLKAIAGVVRHTGRVTCQGTALTALPPRVRAREIAYLAQAARADWPMTVRDLVELGRLPYRRFGAPLAAEDEHAVTLAMQAAEVTSLAERSAQALSGGETARVMLARALAVAAPILLADEPVSALDPYHQLQIMGTLRHCARSGRLVIAVLHDLGLAARFCERVLLMHEGRIAVDGLPDEVLNAATLRRYYRIEPFMTRHAGEPVILPWQRLDSP
jgi:iron complex transport system ATP-binding protein